MATIQEAIAVAMDQYRAGRMDQVAFVSGRILEVDPSRADAHLLRGLALRAGGDAARARRHVLRALSLEPAYASAFANLALILAEAPDGAEAAFAACRRALRLGHGLEGLEDGLGTLLADCGREDAALPLLRIGALRDPGSAEALRKLAIVEQRRDGLNAARRGYRRAFMLSRDPALLLREALALPIVPGSLDEIASTRARFAAIMAELEARNAPIADPMRQVGVTSFYLSYHGLDDRPLNEALARVYAGGCPSLLETAPHCLEEARPAPDGRIRIGFVSDYFFHHTIGQLNRGLIGRLSRERFHITLFLRPGPDDSFRRGMAAGADTVVDLSGDLGEARRRIAERRLDVLYYPDIGMSPFTYFLAFARLAPVQCVAWGHPDTTGIASLDHFLSCGAMEPEDGERHYREPLVRLPGPTVYYHRPILPVASKGRADFGLPEDAHVYLCPQSIFKLHPDFDDALAELLDRDPRGLFVLVDPRRQARLFLERIGRRAPSVLPRIMALPGMSNADFLALMAVSDVMLDPLHYSGGNTTLEAFSVGLPVVTWPGAFMRGRHTHGFYRLMGVEDCVAADHRAYVDLAHALGTDRDRRAAASRRILDSCGVLYENTATVRALEDFLDGAVRTARR